MCRGPSGATRAAELDDGAKPHHRRADADTGKAQFRDGRIHDAHLPEFLEQSLRDLVRALIHADFLAHEEDAIVALHLFAQRLIEGIPIRDYSHWTIKKEFAREVTENTEEWLIRI